MDELDSELHRLALSSYEEFADIADYIWKCPNLIESETKIEIEKLKEYFPLKGDSEHDETARRFRKIRWQHEGRKLRGVFPYVMANGNLFTCISVFETHCLMLCKAIEKRSNIALFECKGLGISRCFNFLSKVPINLNRLSFRREVLSAILIRNCLFHASGILEWSRDKDELRRIVAKRTYWSDYTRSKISEQESLDVSIVNTKLGDQLQITNEYSHVVSNYLKFQFIDLCKKSQLACNKKCTIELPTTPYYLHTRQAASDAS
jgi:hypothetical protein